jgi:hydrogenase expression/formation protein HypE
MELLGKIENAEFEDIILNKCGYARNEVTYGPGFGVDVSVIDIPGGQALCMTSDPLSLIPSLGLEESAWLSVHLMANDMATTGFSPMYVQFVLNLPPWLSKEDFKIYWNYIHKFCKEIGVAITGGHTGAIEGQNSTISGGGTMSLIAPKADVKVSKMAQPGDIIILTKECAISSAAILAMSFPETVKNKLGKEMYEAGCSLFYQTSSLKDALVAVGPEGNLSGVRAMHDVTEGGVLGAIYEMAVASGNGVFIDNSLLPLGEVPSGICRLFDIDPRFCIGAGSMVIAAKKGYEDELVLKLQNENIPATIVGQFVEKDKGKKILSNEGLIDLPYFSKDPYWSAFFNAYKNGWK